MTFWLRTAILDLRFPLSGIVFLDSKLTCPIAPGLLWNQPSCVFLWALPPISPAGSLVGLFFCFFFFFFFFFGPPGVSLSVWHEPYGPFDSWSFSAPGSLARFLVRA